MTSSHNSADAFQADLRQALVRRFSDDQLQLESVSRRGEGYSWETYIVSVRRGDHVLERYAVKREPNAGLLGTYDVLREVALLEAARNDVGCPVPEVITHQPRQDETRGFYIMEMVSGIVPMPWDVKKLVPDEAIRHQVGLELAAIMARLHGKDANELNIAGMARPGSPAATGFMEARKWRDIYLDCMSMHVPVIDLAFAWLEHRADCVSGRVALVHNDMRIGNVILNDGHVAAVLDWETAEFTDPSADLAKFNLPTFRGRSSRASGLIEWQVFLDAYEAALGWRPTESMLNYWTVLEIVKAAVGSLRGFNYFETGKTDDLRYANMGWQIHHQVKWLVELFENGTWGR